MKISTGIPRDLDFDSLSEESYIELSDQARKAAKAVRTVLARKLLAESGCSAVEHPLSLFMAGAPGAGKTEVSKGLVSNFDRGEVWRLDPDDLRAYFDCYNGANSHVIQRAISPIVERCIDLSRDSKVHLIVDGTLSSWPVAERNILNALKAKRTVVVMFVLQDPLVSWEFVKAREHAEGRRIKKEVFIEQYFGSIDVMNKVIATFSPRVITWCTVKDSLKDKSEITFLKTGNCLESLIEQHYTRETL